MPRAAQALVVSAVALAGCGSATSSPAVLWVGDRPISAGTVEHWASAIDRGAIVANVVNPIERSAHQQALALLIDSNWVLGEAAREGLTPRPDEIARLVREQQQAAGGRAEFKETLEVAGLRPSDAEFEAKARWAASALARRLAANVERGARAQVGAKPIARFYRLHAPRYHLRERRFYDLIERIPSRARALSLKRQIGSGRRFAAMSSKERPFRPLSFRHLRSQAVVYRAVFAAKKVGVVVGPLPLQGMWSLFVIRRIEPARVQPLSEVRTTIERRLLALARTEERARLVEAYRMNWTRRTDCSHGYVVQKCRQYHGARRPEREPFAGF